MCQKGAKTQNIINLEPQMKEYLGYSVVTRAIFYVARLISSQKDNVFYNSEYQKIQKVASIWFCKGGARESSITSYKMEAHPLLGRRIAKKYDYDKAEIVVITLGTKKSDDPLIGKLQTLLSKSMSRNKKKETLEHDFGVPVDCELKEAIDVCAYAESVRDEWKEECAFATFERCLKKHMTEEEAAEISDLPIERYYEIRKNGLPEW